MTQVPILKEDFDLALKWFGYKGLSKKLDRTVRQVQYYEKNKEMPLLVADRFHSIVRELKN